MKVRLLQAERQATTALFLIELGEVSVTEKVVGYKKSRLYTSENVGYGQVNLPELTMHTDGLWLTATEAALDIYTSEVLDDAIRGLGNALRPVASLFLLCSVRDIGKAPRGSKEELAAGDPLKARPGIYFYDRRPGGVGLTSQLFAIIDRAMARTLDLIAGCRCRHGCPSCVGPQRDKSSPVKQIAIEIASAFSNISS